MEEKREKRTVMFVDDEINILSSLRRGLRNEAYDRIFVSSAKDALLELEDKKIDVIVTDMRMPEMTGLELLKIVEKKYPDIVKIVLSGYTQLPQILATINQVNIFKFITKPWKLEEEFKKIIQEAIDLYNIKDDNRRLKSSIENKNTLYQKLLKVNDEKLKSSKQDSIIIKKCLSIAINHTKESTLVIEDEFDRNHHLCFIEFMASTMEKITSILPTYYKDFSFKELVEELEELLKLNNDFTDELGRKKFADSKIKISCYDNCELEKYRLYGIYRPLIIAFDLILNTIYIDKFEDEFNIILKEESKNNNIYKFLVLINSKTSKIVKDTFKLNFLRDILESILEYYHGSLRIKNDGSEHVVIMELNINSGTK